MVLQIDFACDVNGEVENPDVAQVSKVLCDKLEIWMFQDLFLVLFLFEVAPLVLCHSCSCGFIRMS